MVAIGAAADELRTSLGLLRERRFATFWWASLLLSRSQGSATSCLGASPFLVGLDAFVLNAPVWLLTLMGGWLADRADHRRVIVIFQSIQMLCPTTIVVLLLTGAVKPALTILLLLAVGITDASRCRPISPSCPQSSSGRGSLRDSR